MIKGGANMIRDYGGNIHSVLRGQGDIHFWRWGYSFWDVDILWEEGFQHISGQSGYGEFMFG